MPSTRTPRARRLEPSQIGPLAILALAAALLLLAAGGRDGRKEPARTLGGTTWLGLVGEGRPPVAVGERLLVVLKAPSLARRVRAAGGRVGETRERRWTKEAAEGQKALLSRLELQGVQIRPEFSYTRVLNGFSAALEPRAVSLLERAPEVHGVYPVRAAYPASLSRFDRAMRTAAENARPPGLVLPGYDGAGVTIALLDTGVDRLSPYVERRVEEGIDIIGGDDAAEAEVDPSDSSRVERHGTELAGVLVGRDGPFGLAGVAPGATVLPVRIAGWQRDASGRWAIYGRTDQLIAGLEAAVDPNRDGDAHDAARVALVGVTEPYAAFATGPAAIAVNGALDLDTLVVVPVGNDGSAGPVYGSISGPAGARSALSVGAADLRAGTSDVRVAVRVGLQTRMSRLLPLAGAVAPSGTLSLEVAAPPPPQLTPADRASGTVPPPALDSFFEGVGTSRVAGKAALVRAGTSPEAAVENAARAGAYAILLYGTGLPAGALGLDENVDVPVVGIPIETADRILADLRRHDTVTVTIGGARASAGAAGGRIADFSSRGLAFDGGVKPDLVAPGVSIPTSEPGVHDDGTGRFGTVNGTSVAAAGVAGAAALLAQARPALGAAELMGALVGSARPLPRESLTVQGTGLVDVGAATAAEVAARPASLAFPPVVPGRRAKQAVTVRNVSTRRLDVSLSAGERQKGLGVSISPRRLRLGPGRSRRVTVVVRKSSSERVYEGALRIATAGSTIRVPWVFATAAPVRLLAGVCLTTGEAYAREPQSCRPVKLPAFRASDTAPAVLVLRAGLVIRSEGRQEVRPVKRLDIGLRTKAGRDLGLLAQLRDLLPGHYAFGLTGRGPSGEVLGRGVYRLTLTAAPAGPGRPSRGSVEFRIRR